MDDRIAGELALRRRQRGEAHDRYQAVTDVILEDMQHEGTFLRTSQTGAYYIPNTSRRPLAVSKMSGELEMFLCHMYELNPVEKDCEYVMAAITAHALNSTATGTEHVLSAFHTDQEALYLHTGADALVCITADHITDVPNGTENMVFLWNGSGDTFHPTMNGKSARRWWEYLFHDAVALTVDIEPEEAGAILSAWFMFLLFRDLAASRPILATLGQPGSGKSVLMKRIYMMLYGAARGISSITTPDNFDMAVASNPFVAFDNIDISTRWLPDRLAQCSSVTEIEKRQLYTDRTQILLRRHALVGITSHNPEFTRADVADRLLIITLRRWEKHLAEGILLGALEERRDRLWGGIVQTCQDILSLPRPRPDDAPSMRIQDFAYLGTWFARAMDQEAAFLSGLTRLMMLQRTFALSEEQLLVECLDLVIPTDWMPAGELFRLCATACKDGGTEFRFQYRNAATLGRRLVALQHPLRDFFRIENRPSHKHGREWRITHPLKEKGKP